MSSAENGRLCWIENALWADLAEVMAQSDHPYAPQVHEALIAARDAAPADPAEAIAAELREIWDDHSFMDESREDAAKVLRALGMPDVPQRPTPRDEAAT